MKYCMFLIMFAVLGCSSVKPAKTEPAGGESKIEFNVGAGKFERFQLTTWKPGESQCLEFSISELHNTSKWLAAVTFYIESDDGKHMAKVTLFTEDHKSSDLSFSVSQLIRPNDQVRRKVLAKNIKLNEKIRFDLFFPNEKTLGIAYNQERVEVPLDFIPGKMLVGASSAVATVKIIYWPACSQL